MVNEKEVKHLAWLAKIELEDRDMRVYTEQINEILRYFDKLDKVSLENIRVTQITTNHTKLREDISQESTDNVLGVVKSVKDQFVKGPKMV